jgi:hypothetical protein
MRMYVYVVHSHNNMHDVYMYVVYSQNLTLELIY